MRASAFLPVSGIAASKTNQATTPTVERAKKVALYPVLTTRNPAAALLSEPAIPCTVPSTPRAALYRPVPSNTSASTSGNERFQCAGGYSIQDLQAHQPNFVIGDREQRTTNRQRPPL